MPLSFFPHRRRKAGFTLVAEASLPYRRNGMIKVEVEHATAKLVREHASYVLFNAATGEAVEVYDAAKSPVAARLYYAMEPLHFGRLGGRCGSNCCGA